MNRKTIALLLALTLCLMLCLSGCGHKHTWAEATCSAPKTCTECGTTEGEALPHTMSEATCAAPATCAVCGVTEGEALPHTMSEATCAAPATCTVCGTTEGEALPHTLKEANYQAPATCTVCGATEGDVLTPDFVTHAFPLAQVGVTQDCILSCYDNAQATTVAHVTVTDYRVFSSSDDYPAKEGYEYRQADFEIFCDDDNAYNYGVGGWGASSENYYDIKGNDDSAVHDEETGIGTYTANFNGENVEFYALPGNAVWGDWVDGTITGTVTFTALVPVGYDGAVVGVYNRDIEYPEDGYITDIFDAERFVLFRMA